MNAAPMSFVPSTDVAAASSKVPYKATQRAVRAVPATGASVASSSTVAMPVSLPQLSTECTST